MFDPLSLGRSEPPRPAERAHAGVPLDASRVMAALRAHRIAIALAAIASGGLGAGAAAGLLPREYKSAVSVVRDTQAGPLTEGERTSKVVSETVVMPAQLAEVRRRLALPTTLEKLAKRISVDAVADSPIATIRCIAETPEAAVVLADTTAAAFLDTRRELARSRAEETRAALDDDLQTTRASVEAARRAYGAFCQSHGIADPAVERTAAVEEAAHLRAEADLAGADALGEEARTTSLHAAGVGRSELVLTGERFANPAASRLRESEADLATLRERLPADHPRLLAKSAEVDSLRAVAAAPSQESERTLGTNAVLSDVRRGLVTARSQRAAAMKRRAALDELAAAAHARATDLTALEGQAATLLATVRSGEMRLAEREVERLRADDAARNPAAGYRVSAGAQRPDHPERSMRRVVVAAAALLGAIVSALVALARSLRGFAVMTAGEAAFWTGLPVLGASPWPTARDALPPLAADLAELLPSGASVFVVASRPEDRELATSLALSLATAAGCLARGVVVRPAASEDPVEIRRAARGADRVIVLVRAGTSSAFSVRAIASRIGGAPSGMGIALVDASVAAAAASDRVGDLRPFSTSAHSSEHSFTR